MTLIVNDSMSSRYPSAWREFNDLFRTVPWALFDFAQPVREVNRWAARYRAANSFDGLKMVEYRSPATVLGYSELVRAILVWSAFERYLDVVGLNMSTSHELLGPFKPERVVEEIRTLDTNIQLFSYVCKRLNHPPLRASVKKYLAGEDCKLSDLLRSVRHIFGHGYLSPGSAESNSAEVAEICNKLCTFHMTVMDQDFERRVADVHIAVYGE